MSAFSEYTNGLTVRIPELSQMPESDELATRLWIGRTLETLLIANLALRCGISDEVAFRATFDPIVAQWRDVCNAKTSLQAQRGWSTTRVQWVRSRFVGLRYLENLLEERDYLDLLQLKLDIEDPMLVPVGAAISSIYQGFNRQPSSLAFFWFQHFPNLLEEQKILEEFYGTAMAVHPRTFSAVDAPIINIERFSASIMRGYISNAGYLSEMRSLMVTSSTDDGERVSVNATPIWNYVVAASTWRANSVDGSGPVRLRLLHFTVQRYLRGNKALMRKLDVNKLMSSVREVLDSWRQPDLSRR